MPKMTFEILACWDDEAEVWYVAESDVPGLSTGADTLEELVEKLKTLVPEMLEENGVIPQPHDAVPFELIARRSTMGRSGADGR